MVRRSLTAFLVAAATFACTGAAAGASPVTACDNPADSALNQYCETIPGTGGGQVPGAGERSLSGVLPHSVIAKILVGTRTPAAGSPRHRERAAELLSLPAPAHYRARAAGSAAQPTAAATVPLSTWAIAIVAALLVALAGGTLVARRRADT
jgi:hypothetical protein